MRPVPFGSGAYVHVCAACARLFVPPRAWSRAFEARDEFRDLESSFGVASRGDLAPLARCPVCDREMDRARFAATSPIVIDACAANHGVSIANGDLARVVDYAEHKARVGDEEAAREADAAWAPQHIDPGRREAAFLSARLREQNTDRSNAAASRAAILVVALLLIPVILYAASHRKPQASASTTATPSGPLPPAPPQEPQGWTEKDELK